MSAPRNRPHVQRKRALVRLIKTARRRARSYKNYMERVKAAGRLGPEHDAEVRAAGRLTNWQRNQWARAGYPGGARVVEFAAMRRRTEA